MPDYSITIQNVLWIVMSCTKAGNSSELGDDDLIIAYLKNFEAFVFLSQLGNFKYPK